MEIAWKNKNAEDKLVGNIFSDNHKNNSNYDADKSLGSELWSVSHWEISN